MHDKIQDKKIIIIWNVWNKELPSWHLDGWQCVQHEHLKGWEKLCPGIAHRISMEFDLQMADGHRLSF